MTDEQKFQHLLEVLKNYAETPHCYEYQSEWDGSGWDGSFDCAANYGEIAFARTLLEQIGVEFQYPVMKEE
jgi:hypothetical protein